MPTNLNIHYQIQLQPVFLIFIQTMKKNLNKVKQSSSILQKQLQILNDHINNFLQHDFSISMHSKLQKYCLRLKNLFIDLATLEISPIITNIMSKIGNVLQPLTWLTSKDNKQKMKSINPKYQKCVYCQNQESQKVKKMHRKITKMNNTLDQYRLRSNKLTNLLYFLNLNGLDTNQFYRASQTRIKEFDTHNCLIRNNQYNKGAQKHQLGQNQTFQVQNQETSIKKSRRKPVQYTDFDIERYHSTRNQQSETIRIDEY